MNKARIWLAPFAAFALSATAEASVIYNGATNIAGNMATAQATFTIAGNVLQIELRNTSPLPGTGEYKPGDTLTGLSFKLPGATLTPSSAASPNALFLPVACDIGPCGGTNMNVGGEWGQVSLSRRRELWPGCRRLLEHAGKLWQWIDVSGGAKS